MQSSHPKKTKTLAQSDSRNPGGRRRSDTTRIHVIGDKNRDEIWSFGDENNSSPITCFVVVREW